MKYAEFYQMLLTSCSNPQMVANAFEEYYRRVYERSLQTNRSIIECTNPVEPEYPSYTTLADSSGDSRYVSTYDLQYAFALFNQAVEDGNIPDLDLLSTITLTDAGTGEQFKITFQDVAEQLGNAADACYLTWQGFSAVAQETLESAQTFYNAVSMKVTQATANISNTASKIYSVLTNAGNSITNKLRSMTKFVGIDEATTNPSGVTSNIVDLGAYTGANPVTSWFNGVDWSTFGKNFVGTLFTPALCVQKFINHTIKTVFTTIWSGVKKLFSWFGSKIKTTFVDPVDYECKDDTLQFFKLPGKFQYTVDLTTNNGRNIAAAIRSLDTDNVGVWYGDGPVYYRVLQWVENLQQRTFTFYYEQYVKPLNLNKLVDVLQNYFIVDNVNHTISWNTIFSSYPSHQQLLDLLTDLADADLSLDNKSSELSVWKGIQVAKSFADCFSILKGDFLSNLMYENAQGNMEINNYVLDTVLLSSSLDTGRTAHVNCLTRFADNLLDVYAISLKGSGRNDLTGFGIYSMSPYSRISTSTINSLNTITNLDFINAVGDTMGYHPSSNTYQLIGIASASDGDGFCYANSDMSTYSALSYKYNCPIISNSVILYACRRIQAGTDYDGAYIPYLVGDLTDFKRNIDIKTDAQNADVISKFLKGAAIVAVAVTAGIVVGVAISRMINAYKKISFTRDTIAFNYGDALSKGNIEEAETLYKQYKAYNLKANLLSMGLGASTSITGSNNKIDLSTLGVAQYNNENIVNLIKGNN